MADLQETLRLDVEQLTARCDPAWLPFENTDDLPALDAVFGQERAVRAIEFALGMETPGYNLFASGPDGFGKSTIVESFLRRRAAQMPAPSDWIYVHNFEDPDRPVGIALPAGQGRVFAAQVADAVEAAIVELRTAFESDDYARRRQALATDIEQQRTALLEDLQGVATQMGFALQISPTGILSAPLQDGDPLTEEQFLALEETVDDRAQLGYHRLQILVGHELHHPQGRGGDGPLEHEGEDPGDLLLELRRQELDSFRELSLGTGE